MDQLAGVILGHANMDLDCLGSMVLAKLLYPAHVALRNQRLHPQATNILRLYGEHIDVRTVKELGGLNPAHIVVVDTRDPVMLKEYADVWPGFAGKLTVFDHHVSEKKAGAVLEGLWPARRETELVEGESGSNTGLIFAELMKRGTGITLTPNEALVAMCGIFADTGHFTHANVGAPDFEAARFLLGAGARLPLVHRFVSGIFDEHTAQLQHRMINSIENVKCNGSQVLMCALDLEQQTPGLALIVERIFELEQADALFCVCSLSKDEAHLVIARSRVADIDVALVLAPFGGGGHPQSASALVKKSLGIPIREHLKRSIAQRAGKTTRAADIMTARPDCVGESWTMLAASLFLEEHNHSGAPVLNTDGSLTGMLSLYDIQKARKVGRMQSPVKAFMQRSFVSFSTQSDMREVENLFFHQDVHHVPVVEGESIAGLICRSDLLKYLQDKT